MNKDTKKFIELKDAGFLKEPVVVITLLQHHKVIDNSPYIHFFERGTMEYLGWNYQGKHNLSTNTPDETFIFIDKRTHIEISNRSDEDGLYITEDEINKARTAYKDIYKEKREIKFVGL